MSDSGRIERQTRPIIKPLTALVLAFAAGSALARPQPWPDAQQTGAAEQPVAETGAVPAQRVMPAQGQISLQQAIEIATRRYPGTVVSAETTTRDGRVVHEIRILGEDRVRVRTVRVDAQSGDAR
jgi:hypothetical protein